MLITLKGCSLIYMVFLQAIFTLTFILVASDYDINLSLEYANANMDPHLFLPSDYKMIQCMVLLQIFEEENLKLKKNHTYL